MVRRPSSRIVLVCLLGACARSAPPPTPAPHPAPPAAPAPRRAPSPDTVVNAAARRPPRGPVRLAFVGDINLGTTTFPNGVPADSGRAFLAGAKPFLVGDLVIGNFEGVLADSGESTKCGGRANKSGTAADSTDSIATRAALRATDTTGTSSTDSIVTRRTIPAADTTTSAPTGSNQVSGSGTRSVGGKHGSAPRKPTHARSRNRKPAADSLATASDSLPRQPAPCYAFRTPTHLASRLVDAGFTHLNLANNHANDLGLAGRATTDSTLAALGLTTYGPLGRVAIDTVRRDGRATIVGLIGFATYPFAYDLLDVPRSVAVIDSMRPLVDLLIVTFHGGAEGAAAQHVGPGPEFLGREPRGDLRTWAHAVIDAGADAVVGHGPHVLRGIEFYRGRAIAYSLGNFATYRGFNVKGPLGVTGVLQLSFAAGGALAGARLEPMRQFPQQGPKPDGDRTAIRLVRALSTQDFGPDAARIEDDGTIRAP
jgi:hypothetical protein